MQETRTQTIFFFSLLGIVAILNVAIFLPYLSPLVIALTVAVMLRPMYKYVLKQVKRPFLASLISVILVLFLLVIPFALLGWQIFVEAENLYSHLSSSEGSSAFNQIVDQVLGPIKAINPSIAGNIGQYTRQVADSVLQNVGPVFSGIFNVVLKFFLMLFALFFIWKDGEKLKKAAFSLSPMSDEFDRAILKKMEAAIDSVIRGQLTIALVQGLVTMVGFLIFGVPNPVLWGSIAAIAALIPSVGTTLVILPAVVYLYITGNTGSAIGLAVWGAFAVGFIDNLLAPVLLTKNIKVHPFLILLSVLGGIGFFGIIGFLLGPLLLTLFVALLDSRKAAANQS